MSRNTCKCAFCVCLFEKVVKLDYSIPSHFQPKGKIDDFSKSDQKLIYGICYNKSEIVREALFEGANFGIEDQWHSTPIYLCVITQKPDVLIVILEYLSSFVKIILFSIVLFFFGYYCCFCWIIANLRIPTPHGKK